MTSTSRNSPVTHRFDVQVAQPRRSGLLVSFGRGEDILQAEQRLEKPSRNRHTFPNRGCNLVELTERILPGLDQAKDFGPFERFIGSAAKGEGQEGDGEWRRRERTAQVGGPIRAVAHHAQLR